MHLRLLVYNSGIFNINRAERVTASADVLHSWG